jgi:hypothetical protein
MSILKTTMIILIIITVTVVSGCLDEEPVILTDPTPTPTQPQSSSTISVNTTLKPIPIITDIPAPTPIPKLTPKPINISDGSEIPWCNIKKECDAGIRSYKSELCVSTHEMSKLTMDYYCGTAPIQTPNESATKPPRTEQEQKAFDDEYGVGFK